MEVAAGGDGDVAAAAVGERGGGERTGESAGERVEVKGKLKLRATGFSLTTRWSPAGMAPPANSLRHSPTTTTIFLPRQITIMKKIKIKYKIKNKDISRVQ